MYDAVLYNGKLAADRSRILHDLDVQPGAYLLATVHRPRNTDHPERLRGILEALALVAGVVVLPAHPRTRKAILDRGQRVPSNVRLIEPVGYLDMLCLEQQAKAILTDSGGIQKEAYIFGVPCITLREETEWVETVQAGWNRLVGAEPRKILAAVQDLRLPTERPPLFGDGHAAERIVTLIE
jgi:UDP-N-acetylglucosamine 2-epimerase